MKCFHHGLLKSDYEIFTVEAVTNFSEAFKLKQTIVHVVLIVGIEGRLQILEPFHIFFYGIREVDCKIKDEKRNIEVFYRQTECIPGSLPEVFFVPHHKSHFFNIHHNLNSH